MSQFRYSLRSLLVVIFFIALVLGCTGVASRILGAIVELIL
jgi:hypothetical protein